MRFMLFLMFAAMATITLGGLSVNVNAATFVVNTTADTQDAAPGNGTCADSGGQCSLRAAISEANALAGADIITLPAGTYTHSLAGANENANAGGDFDITTPLTINGAGSATTIVQSNAAPNTATERVFHVLAGGTAVTINGVTIQNGKALDATDGGRGAGIKAGENNAGDIAINLTVTNSAFLNNFADTRGGGIAINKGNLTVTGCTFTGNRAGSAFGTGGAGGALLIDSQDNVTIATQTASVTNTVMSNNTANTSVASAFGGAVINRAQGSTLDITGSTISGNTCISTFAGASGNGGGLYNQNATMNITNSVVTGNSSSHFVGGVRALSSNTITATNITNSSITNNTATGAYGGAFNVVIGAAEAPMTIRNSTISNNTVTDGDSQGGGVTNINSGAAGTGSALLDMANSTVSNNTAADLAGVNNDGSAAVLLMTYCTVSNNTANNVLNPEGAGIFQGAVAGGSTFIQATVVANNTAQIGPDIDGVVNSLDFNHIENTSGGTFTPGANDVTGTDPALLPLANNGGPTQTHLPDTGSPLLNRIPNGMGDCGTTYTTDQRGSVRPFGAGCDKGSVEVGPAGASPTPTPTPSPSVSPTPLKSRADFDGDNRTDLSVFRPSEGNWYLNQSTAGFRAQNWGASGDLTIPGDFDNDNKTDFGIFRPATDPANLDFFILLSATGTFTSASWGLPGDLPMSGDFDADGRTDFAVFRPSNSTWYVLRSGGGFERENFGSPGDIPMVMDFEGDGRADYTVFRPSNGIWYIAKETGVPAQNFFAIVFGLSTDTPVPADYDGDRKDDIAMFRASEGIWYILQSTNGAVRTSRFGVNGDVPVPGDYDGDGSDDVAVYRNGIWFLNRSTSGLTQSTFGVGSDVPVPKRYIP